MKITWLSVVLFPLLFSSSTPKVADNWELKKDRNGIKVYYRDSQTSDIKELKMVMTMDASMSTIMALLYDISLYPNWVYTCTEAKVAKQVSDKELYYYSKMDFPWPLNDRDVIAHSTIHQDPKTGKVTSDTKAAPDFLPEKADVVRIKNMQVHWSLTPQKDGTVYIEYFLTSDPGGNIPAWAINMGLDRGPVQSMLKFKELLKEEKYKNTRLAFIDDFGTGK